MKRHAPILYAEDDENDRFLTELAFKEAEVCNPLIIVPDGKAAIDHLSDKCDNGQDANRDKHPLPCLVLLDLKMPGRSGLDVLKWIRSQPNTCTVPVLILTSSTQDRDVHRAYILGANGYLEKPNQPDQMLLMAKAIKDFWLTLNRSPRPEAQTS